MPRALFKRKIRNATPVAYARNAPNSLFTFDPAAPTETALRAYTKSGTVYGIVSLLATSVARVEWRLYRKSQDNRVRYSTADTGSDQRTEVFKHQALQVLNNPNPFMTRMELFEISQTFMELTGESWWIVGKTGDNPNGIPISIWPVDPTKMQAVQDANNFVSGYIYTDPSGEKVPFKANEVIISKNANPLNMYRGVSPVNAVMADIEAGDYSAQYNRNFFYNDASPGGIIETPNELSDEELDTFTNRWRETHRGLSRAHRVAILEAGMTWVEAHTNAKDMDFVNLDKNTRDKIREAWRIHPIMLGITDDVNRANALTGEEVHNNSQTIPKLDKWQDVLNNKFLPMFDSAALKLSSKNYEFSYIAPIPSNREQDNAELVSKAEAAQKLVNAGYDPHDVLEVVGLPDMDVAEKATQAPVAPPGWVPEPPAPTAPGQAAPPSTDSNKGKTQ